jgi:hypothetical protein
MAVTVGMLVNVAVVVRAGVADAVTVEVLVTVELALGRGLVVVGGDGVAVVVTVLDEVLVGSVVAVGVAVAVCVGVLVGLGDAVLVTVGVSLVSGTAALEGASGVLPSLSGDGEPSGVCVAGGSTTRGVSVGETSGSLAIAVSDSMRTGEESATGDADLVAARSAASWVRRPGSTVTTSS